MAEWHLAQLVQQLMADPLLRTLLSQQQQKPRDLGINFNPTPEQLQSTAPKFVGEMGGSLKLIKNADDALALKNDAVKGFVDKMLNRLGGAVQHADVPPGNSYYDSAAGARITKDRVLQELKRHGHDWQGMDDWAKVEIQKLFGPDGKMDAQDLLGWLGY